jgi:hypothetical protein
VIGILATVLQEHASFSQLQQPPALSQAGASTPAAPAPGPAASVLPPAPGAAGDPWQTLMTHIPAALAPGCAPWTGDSVGSNAGLTAAIHCAVTNAPGQPDSYYYYQYSDQATLDNAFLLMTLTQQNKMGKDTTLCAQGTPSAGSFYYQTGAQQTSPPVAGFMACGQGYDGQAFIDSTDNRTFILTDISGANMTLPQLYAFWNSANILR